MDFESHLAKVEDLTSEIEREERNERPERNEAETGFRTHSHIVTDEYRDAFLDYCRFGAARMRPERRMVLEAPELRAQAVGTGSAGGYVVPQGFQAQLEKALKAYGGMRSVSSILQTASGNDMPWPTVNDTAQVGEWLAENTQAAGQDVAFGQVTFKAYKCSSKKVPVSIELLQDSGVNLESELANLLATRLGRLQNTAFTIGDGTGKPKGVVLDATLGKTGANGQMTTVTYADLVDLIHAVDPLYRPNCRWMFADSTLKAVLKLADSQQRPLWLPFGGSVAVGEPSNILGYPFTINQDVAAMAASAKSILFGDFSKYKIRDVMGFTLLRLDEVAADYGQVIFLAFARVDGRLLDAGTHPVVYYANSAT